MAHLLLIDDDPQLLPDKACNVFPAPAHQIEVATTGASVLRTRMTRSPFGSAERCTSRCRRGGGAVTLAAGVFVALGVPAAGAAPRSGARNGRRILDRMDAA